MNPKPSVRNLRVGDCFRWKNPPPGWTTAKVKIVDKIRFAAPRGWDYLPIDLLDGEIELVEDTSGSEDT